MAQVTLQAVVNFEQVNQLQQKIDKLNGQKITIGVQDFSKQLQDADKSLSSVNDNLTKTVRVFNADGELTKGVDEFERGVATTVRVTHKLNEETGKLEKTQTRVSRNLKKEQREAAKAQEAHTEEVKKGNDEVKKQGLLYDILGRSVSSFFARMSAYRAVYAGIRAITNGFKEALETLKAVDDELVTVRKVTGFDAAQMADVESQAYAVASKYGASAADYTSSVAAFARAGYKEVSTDLAELAEKTKIVGDTTADVAQQFLLSVDAAYKYRGDVEKLSAVLDGMNEIDNKFATSIERIAEGMGIVAPVAAQMNVSVDELAAGIGTITAVTQRSGTEAARALRAIFLNIVGDTKTEIEEGVTWTTGEIAGLRDVIKLYAKDAYDAAQASGEVIDPMRAIAGLAQSVKDGVLSEAKLTEMVSDIGGKLRTSQLLAIVNNWDMYENMLQTYRTAYGSAEKEIENAMDSWTRKTNVLKNTWTQFVKTGLNSEAVKGFLDILTSIVQRLGTLPGVLTRIAVIVVGMKLPQITKSVTTFFSDIKKNGIGSINGLSAAIAGLGVAWSIVSYIIEDQKRKHEEMVAKIYEEADASKESSDKILELYADFNSAKEGSDALADSAKRLAEALGEDIPEGAEAAGKALDELTLENLQSTIEKLGVARATAEKEFQDILKDAIHGKVFTYENFTALDRNNNGPLPEEIRSYVESVTGQFNRLQFSQIAGYTGGIDVTSIEEAVKVREAYQSILDEMDAYMSKHQDYALMESDYYKDVREFLAKTEESYKKYYDTVSALDEQETKKRFLELSSAIRVDSVEAYEKLIDTINLKNRGSDEEREALVALAEQYYPQFSEALNNAAEAEKEVTEAAKNETDAIFANQKALEANATAADRAAAAKKDAEAAVAAHIDALFDETGALTDVGRAAFTASQYLAGLAQAQLDSRMEAARANYATLRAELAGVSAQALKAAYALIAIEDSVGNGQGIVVNEYNRIAGIGGGQAGRAAKLLRQIQSIEAEMNSITAASQAVKPYAPPTSSGGGRSSGTGGRSSGTGGSSSSSSIGSKSTEDKKLTALQERVKLLKSELSLMKERGDSEEDQIAKMREIQKALRKEYKYLKSIKGDQITINNLYQEWYSYANQISDLEGKAADEAQKHADAIQAAVEAQKALDNILKNRSVRVYNAATGQWEWQADPAAVASAQSDLNNAISSAGYTQDTWALLYSALSGIASIKDNWLNSGPGAVSNAFGGNSYGNTYNFGRISLSEVQAQNMTVAEFARLANALPAFNNSP